VRVIGVIAALGLAVVGTVAGTRPGAAPGSPPGTASSPPGSSATAPPASPPPPPARVLPATAVADSTAKAPTAAELAAELTPLLRSPALGRAAVSVVDATTGDELYESFGSRAQAPASTMKVLTALTALRALGPDTRLVTRVVQGAKGKQVVLVGGGDQTLTRAEGTGEVPAGQQFTTASLQTLAERAAAALRAAHRSTVSVRFDDGLFTGPSTAPGWPATYVGSGVVSPVSALAVDGGRTAPGALSRSADPAAAAAAYFVTQLRAAGITVQGQPKRASASASAEQLAAVQSPPVSDLVERMLTLSDNDLAEALAHLAGAQDGDGSFAGGALATMATLHDLGVDTDHLVVRDGSGLSLQDRLTATALSTTFAAIAPLTGDTAPMAAAVTGLPVAGLTGTLADRFEGRAGDGRGVVLAKTGTLTGVVTLSGLLRDADGRLLAFAVLADRVVDKYAAEAQVDRMAAALVDRNG
jgi:D-alanyl-D-alanine carboxypeptidase/D-alanyl-D-alanine-endopeptidase (penicillin-binding protein 4)